MLMTAIIITALKLTLAQGSASDGPVVKDQLPTVEQVKHDMQGVTPRDTTARLGAALLWLGNAANAQHSSARSAEYESARNAVRWVKDPGLNPYCFPSYELDHDFVRWVFDHYFSASWELQHQNGPGSVWRDALSKPARRGPAEPFPSPAACSTPVPEHAMIPKAEGEREGRADQQSPKLSPHMSLFGVSLSQPLQLPKCSNFETYSKQPGNMPCWTASDDEDDALGALSQVSSGSELPHYKGRVYLPIDQLPDWVVKIDCPPTLTNITGCSGSNYIEFVTKGGSPTAFKIMAFENPGFIKAMTAKYGKPTTTTNYHFSNHSGDAYDGAKLVWSLPDAHVEFLLDKEQGDIKAHNGVLRGVLWVQSVEYYRSKQEQQQRDSVAQKKRELTP